MMLVVFFLEFYVARVMEEPLNKDLDLLSPSKNYLKISQ